jgi:hypothetical protein
MKKPLIFAAFFCIICLAPACKKDNNNEPQTQTENTLPFVDKRLQMSSFVLSPAFDIDGDGVADTDLMKYLPDCNLDDIVIFEKSGKMSGEGGSNHCPNEKTPNSQAKWTYDSSTQKIKMTDDTDITVWTVVEASSKKLVVKAPIEDNGVSHNAILTMTAK